MHNLLKKDMKKDSAYGLCSKHLNVAAPTRMAKCDCLKRKKVNNVARTFQILPLLLFLQKPNTMFTFLKPCTIEANSRLILFFAHFQAYLYFSNFICFGANAEITFLNRNYIFEID